MKAKVIVLMFLTLGIVAFGQEQEEEFRTLLGNQQELGAYGGFGVEYGQIDDLGALFFTGKAALIMGHNLALGVAGKGFISNYFPVDALYDYQLAGGYGGLFVEPIFFPKSPVHFTVPLLFGVGGITVIEDLNHYDEYEYDNNILANDVFVVFEPGVEVQMNITHFFRIAVGASYRLPSKLEIQDIDVQTDRIKVGPKALEGFSGGVTFKFGKF